MFMIPKAVKCTKCGHKEYSNGAEPLCSKCLHDFLKEHIGVMVKDEDAPPYNPNQNTAFC